MADFDFSFCCGGGYGAVLEGVRRGGQMDVFLLLFSSVSNRRLFLSKSCNGFRRVTDVGVTAKR